MARPKKVVTQPKTQPKDQTFAERLQAELQLKQSYLNLFLGFLIVLVIGVLVFNYFKTEPGNLGPAEQTVAEQTTQPDVTPENLPGKYTVKEGDTLFLVSEKYYKDGSYFVNIAQENKLSNPDMLLAGQVLEIPKLELTPASDSAVVVAEPATSPQPATQAEPAQPTQLTAEQGTGGAVNQTQWGETIKGDTYTVAAGDWLSTIAGRAYGDIYAFDKIAKANNLTNPDLIEPGTVLKIPR